ncbi:Uncharacterised protein [Vibrio cholerae]|uniref:Uncharacterized protein n=1 Tax=Vibrio cholerae TaxID=666 RepID=A0A655S6X2_VIBCL|nr:Uncharacterised protein [Vibrio cholerae]CSB18592.1 Uncharacterised protein [Vibrio cholerae]CSB58355.1 Uncharacterised protein [Vibrio cholerae]CSB85296.1 Uncharacterised protein [Vibrio cholerae]CSC12964.1 Uncharacterised protein [Vibrio cholerae]
MRDDVTFHYAIAQSNRLIGQAKSIAHTAIRSVGEQIECFAVARNLFGVQHFIELLLDIFYTDRFEMELQTARQDGHRQLLWISGCQQKLHILRRLFKRFQ